MHAWVLWGREAGKQLWDLAWRQTLVVGGVLGQQGGDMAAPRGSNGSHGHQKPGRVHRVVQAFWGEGEPCRDWFGAPRFRGL